MSASKRQRLAKATPITSARAPRRCHKCPNYPLKSSCGCSKRHKVVMDSENGVNANLSHLDLLQAPASSNVSAGDSEISLVSDIARSGTPCVSRDTIGVSPGHESQSEMFMFPTGGPGPTPPNVALDSAHCARSVTAAPQIYTALNIDQIPIDPNLLEENSQLMTLGAGTVPEEIEVDNDNGTTNKESHRVENDLGRRLTTAEKAAKFGLVDGAMRGNIVYRIVRQNSKRRPIADAATATTRFNRELPLIISRAERMALETDAYVLVIAQQATGSSASVHFASERLRREAFEGCTQLVNEFQTLMTQLVISKRSTTLALAQSLEASRNARLEIEQKLVEKENDAAHTRLALVDKEAELAASRRANMELLSKLEALRNSMVGQKD